MNRGLLLTRPTGWTCLLVAGLLLTTGPAHGQHTHHPAPAHTMTQDHQQTDDPREDLFFQRRQQDRMNFNEADVNFMVMMIPHHAQALIMSRLAPENGASPALQRLAARILGAQSDEINLMQNWLRDRNQAVPIVSFDGLYMQVTMEQPAAVSHDGHADHTAMHHDEHSGHSMHASEEHENHEMHEGHAAQEGHAGHEAHEEAHTEHEGHDAHAEHDNHEGHTMSSDASNHSMHHGDGASHSMDHAAHDPMHMHHDMPGMLTQEQLNELGTARGAEFDRLFLTYMIDHHLGAILMVNELFGTDGGALDRESYRLASDIYTEQITEIDLMRLMLAEM